MSLVPWMSPHFRGFWRTGRSTPSRRSCSLDAVVEGWSTWWTGRVSDPRRGHGSPGMTSWTLASSRSSMKPTRKTPPYEVEAGHRGVRGSGPQERPVEGGFCHENCGDPPRIRNAEKVNNVTSKFRMKCKEGYLRKAGTSDLFKCENNKWKNSPTLECIRLDTLMPPVPPSPSISALKVPDMDKNPGKSIPTTNGTIVVTTTHNAPTTSRTFHNTFQRTTKTEETSVTTSITALSRTDKEKLTTLCVPSSSITKSTEVAPGETPSKLKRPIEGIAGGIVLIVILGVAATAAILFWRRRRHRGGGHPVEMSIQNPVTPFKDTPESTYTDAPLSA